jgi:YidC/Oxa1 family membrane protein insertase
VGGGESGEVLQFFHAVTGSYGFSILLLTLVVKLLLHPLNVSQTINMQRMQELQPKLKKLKDQIKDPQELQKATVKLYQDYNVNPLGGCLPALVQVPIFIALYWCLRGAIELKGVSYWWIQDLSRPDPTTILALVFAISVYFSGKLMQPAGGAGTEQQAMMNKMMPIMMYGMFVFMPVPAGVMIYMATQSLLGVAETQYNLSKMPKKRAHRTADQAKGAKRTDQSKDSGSDA